MCYRDKSLLLLSLFRVMDTIVKLPVDSFRPQSTDVHKLLKSIWQRVVVSDADAWHAAIDTSAQHEFEEILRKTLFFDSLQRCSESTAITEDLLDDIVSSLGGCFTSYRVVLKQARNLALSQ